MDGKLTEDDLDRGGASEAPVLELGIEEQARSGRGGGTRGWHESCCLTVDGGLALAYPLRLLEPLGEEGKLCGTGQCCFIFFLLMENWACEPLKLH
jgi:hypothetical protein